MNVCEVRHLTKEYPAFSLQDVSFDLEEGKITGFIGRNGAGKTTTIKSMLNLVHPSAGEISFFGKKWQGNEAEIRQRIGFSSGTVNYYPKKKLSDIAAVTGSFYSGWKETEYRNYLKRFELDETKTPSELSEGMKVKWNLLLALSHGAELLILDEPTSGLDPFFRDELTDLFVLLKNLGTTVFFSTHITSDLEKCADRILYIRNGQIGFEGTKEELRVPGETLEQTVLRIEREGRA